MLSPFIRKSSTTYFASKTINTQGSETSHPVNSTQITPTLALTLERSLKVYYRRYNRRVAFIFFLVVIVISYRRRDGWRLHESEITIIKGSGNLRYDIIDKSMSGYALSDTLDWIHRKTCKYYIRGFMEPGPMREKLLIIIIYSLLVGTLVNIILN